MMNILESGAAQNPITHRRIDLGRLIEEVHSPIEAPEVYTQLAENASFPLVQFDWSMIESEGEK